MCTGKTRYETVIGNVKYYRRSSCKYNLTGCLGGLEPGKLDEREGSRGEESTNKLPWNK